MICNKKGFVENVFLRIFKFNFYFSPFFYFTTTFSTRDIVLGNYYVLGLQLIYVEGLIKVPKHADKHWSRF